MSCSLLKSFASEAAQWRSSAWRTARSSILISYLIERRQQRLGSKPRGNDLGQFCRPALRMPVGGGVRPGLFPFEQRNQRSCPVQQGIDLHLFARADGVRLEHQVEIAAVGIAAHVKLQASDGEVLGAHADDVEVEAAQAFGTDNGA